MLRDGDRGRRQLGLEYRADVIDLPPGGDSIGCASRPAAAVAAPALRALICGRAEAPEPSSRHQALVHRSVFDGKVSYSGSRRAIRSALAIIERDREFVDSPLEGTGFEPSVPGNETAIGRASRHRRNWLLEYRSGSVGDRRFESISLQQRVHTNPIFPTDLDSPSASRNWSTQQVADCRFNWLKNGCRYGVLPLCQAGGRLKARNRCHQYPYALIAALQ